MTSKKIISGFGLIEAVLLLACISMLVVGLSLDRNENASKDFQHYEINPPGLEEKIVLIVIGFACYYLMRLLYKRYKADKDDDLTGAIMLIGCILIGAFIGNVLVVLKIYILPYDIYSFWLQIFACGMGGLFIIGVIGALVSFSLMARY